MPRRIRSNSAPSRKATSPDANKAPTSIYRSAVLLAPRLPRGHVQVQRAVQLPLRQPDLPDRVWRLGLQRRTAGHPLARRWLRILCTGGDLGQLVPGVHDQERLCGAHQLRVPLLPVGAMAGAHLLSHHGSRQQFLHLPADHPRRADHQPLLCHLLGSHRAGRCPRLRH